MDGVYLSDRSTGQTLYLGLSKQLDAKNNLGFEYIYDVKVDNAFENRGVRMRLVHAFSSAFQNALRIRVENGQVTGWDSKP